VKRPTWRPARSVVSPGVKGPAPGAMPTALRGHVTYRIVTAGFKCWDRNHAHAEPWAWHPAWVKYDHLGFEVLYVYCGVVRKNRPDFLFMTCQLLAIQLLPRGLPTHLIQFRLQALDARQFAL
jgi:hypothetical protein